jgi:hypothetical protein
MEVLWRICHGGLIRSGSSNQPCFTVGSEEDPRGLFRVCPFLDRLHPLLKE